MAGHPDTFFETDTPHGLVKRIMLKKYMQAYIKKILNFKTKDTNQKILKAIIIDGFAGKGSIDEYGWAMEIEKYGSPMIILLVGLQYFYENSHQQSKTKKEWRVYHKGAVEELVRLTGNEQDPRVQESRTFEDFRLRLFFVEKNRKNYLRLVDNVVKYLQCFFRQINKDAETPIAIPDKVVPISNPTDVTIRHGEYPIECRIVCCEFEKFEPPANTQTGRYVYSRRLTFLDPFGYSATPMDSVQKYLNDSYSEVFINFMSSYVNRFVGLQPEAVARLYGIQLPDDESRQEYGEIVKGIIRLHQDDPRENGQNCSRSYIRKVKEHTCVQGAWMFEMRGRSNNLIYHMIHFFNHREGMVEMKESMNRCTQMEEKFKMSDYKVVVEGIPLNFGNTQNDENAARYIFEEYRGQKDVSMKTIEDFVWEHTPFVFRKKALKILEGDDTRPCRLTVKHAGKYPPKMNGKDRKRSKGTYPDWGNWIFTFSSGDEDADLTAATGAMGGLYI